MPPLLLASSGGGAGTPVPTLPSGATTPSVGAVQTLAPNFTTGATGLDPYRLVRRATLDGYLYVVNGYDQPKRWDISDPTAFHNMGAIPPTGFATSDATGGANVFPLNTVLTYYFVYYNEDNRKESPPQLTSGVPGVSHTIAAANADVKIDWTDPTGEWTHVRIYRRLQDADGFKLVATVTAATETYTDALVDGTIETAAAWIPTYRLALPPVLSDIAAHLNKLWGIVEGSSTLYHSQAVRGDGVHRNEDIPPDWFVQIEPQDGAGGNEAIAIFDRRLYVLKRRGVYEVLGDSIENFDVRAAFRDRGCLSRHTVVAVEDYLIWLDERGLLLWIPGGEPIVAGAGEGTKESPLAPIWARLNLDARRKFWAELDERRGLYILHVALDHCPVPLHTIEFSYRYNRFESIGYMVPGTAGGRLLDAAQREHYIRVDDCGFVHEDHDGLTPSDGAFEGDTDAILTGVTTVSSLDASAAAFDTGLDGPLGSQVQRLDSSLAIVDHNRVVAVPSATRVTMLYGMATTPVAGDQVLIGSYPTRVQLPRMTFGSQDQKQWPRLYLEHREEAAAAVGIYAARDDETLARVSPVAGIPLSVGVRSICKLDIRGYRLTVQFTMDVAGWDFRFYAVTFDVGMAGGAR